VDRGGERTARPSVLDRLIDHDPRVASDPTPTLAESVRRYKESVLRDLEWLLNTRRSIIPIPEECPEVRRSVARFGLPDINSMSGDSDVTRRHLVRDIEECIERFEPRLTGVRVSLVSDADEAQRRVRFVIEGLLRMEPNPERVLFDTELDLSSGRIMVGGAAHA
jgi:type VI secretion system protein ImpF